MTARRGTRSAGALVLAWLMVALAGIAVAEPVAAEESEGQAPTRILLMGDSITHGSAGDWTWRYRLWHHLAATYGAERFDFVGPVDDLHEASQEYVDPAFDRDHGARWGNALSIPYYVPQALVEEHQPDVVVVLLGVNDLTWLQASPEAVSARTAGLVEQLREARPGVDVVLSRVPHHTIKGVPALNELVTELAAAQDTAEERVVVARPDVGFRPSTVDDVQDTYDPAHPTSRGELKIAAAVADALAEIGIGAEYPRPLPLLPIGPRVGSVLSGVAGDQSVTLDWTPAPGTTGEVVWVEDVTAGTGWEARSGVVKGRSTTLEELVNGHTYRILLRPVKGWARADDTASNVLTVMPVGETPPAPEALSGTPDDHAVLLSWDEVPDASSYIVSYRRVGAGGDWQTQTVSATTARLPLVEAGHRHEFHVQAVREGAVSEVGARVEAVPTGPSPKAPGRLHGRRLSAGSVLLSWRAPRHATHYRVSYRVVRRSGGWTHLVTDEPVTDPMAAVPGLRRGRTYAFKVKSWHHGVRGAASRTFRVTMPRR